MKTTLSIFLVFLFFTISTSCKKTEYVKMSPQLKIIVQDVNSQVVANATVTLYLSTEDFQGNQNPVATGTTNNEGVAVFSDLKEINYFFYVEANGKNNYFGISATSQPLEMGVITNLSTTIN